MTEFETLVEATTDTSPELMLFGAPWCPSCEALKPALIQWCQQGGVELLYYNIENDANRQLGQEYGFKLIPAVILWTSPLSETPAYRAAGAFISFARMQDALQPPPNIPGGPA